MQFERFESVDFVTRNPERVRLARFARTKRRGDIGLTLCLAPLAIVIVAPLWCVLKSQGGSGFYGHRRVGRDGYEFTCWKLRTMVPDSEAVLRNHLRFNQAAAREWAHHYKLRNDPRVTRFGRFLRKSSLDELPQLWNVLRGDMSLVGPRPVPRDELVEYHGNLRAYLALRPGITGLWQVSGRNAVAYQDRVSLDLEYARRASLWFDLAILLRTIGVLLRRTGI